MRAFAICICLLFAALVKEGQSRTVVTTYSGSPKNYIDYLIYKVDGPTALTQTHLALAQAARTAQTRATRQGQVPVQAGSDVAQIMTSDDESVSGYDSVIKSRADIIDTLSYLKDVPKRHWSCCMLGVLAGDKGFHCNVEFYSTEIIMRNFNRLHPKMYNFYMNPRLRAPVYRTMQSFSKCVNLHSEEFRGCCKSTTLIRFAVKQQKHARRRQAGGSWSKRN